MTTKIESVYRPESTLSKKYVYYKEYIKQWQANNREYVRKYNREYQRKLRNDPVKYEEMRMRLDLRKYLSGDWKQSYKMTSSLGITREQFAARYDIDPNNMKQFLKGKEIDHIISTSWFNKPENIHLKPFCYRHYNVQVVDKTNNRKKHKWVDETDIRVELVKSMLELDYLSSKNDYSIDIMKKIRKLSKHIRTLEKKIIKIYS